MQDNSDARFMQLMRYISRGWALTPLHDVGGVPGGACSCRLGAACRSAGKHPRVEQWQRPEHLVRDERGVRDALERWPRCNWGLATGLISGVWALDYDPKNVDPARADEVATLLARCWEPATWVQRTGSGGLHFLFSIPEDFVPNNGSGRLPPGFDVRGARRGEAGGGQIVIAPSVSGTGVYELLADRPVTGPPPEVLDAVRPAPPPRVHSALPHVSMAAGADQVGRYATSAIDGELAELRACWTSRNQRAWRAAARCVEMINTGLIGGEAVYAAWWDAGLAHPDRSVNVPDVELLRVWASAERHVGDRPADLSSVGGPASWWGGDAILPSGAPPVPVLGGGPGAAGGASGYPQGVGGVVDIDRQLLDNGLTSTDNDPVSAMIARMLTPEQLRARPNPVPLINGMLDMASCAWLIGAPGSFKSFVALDFAAHVGLGLDWHGHKVRQGLVVYVIAEGDTGMKLREAAWDREHQSLKEVLFLAEPVQADERRAAGQWTVLVEACRRLQPALVIIDTQARVTIGLRENDNSDMSYYAEQADRIKRATGACVLTVHHTGRSGDDARGASSIDGAQDAELKVLRAGKSLSFKLVTDKQKDQAEAAALLLTMRRSEGGVDPQTGRDLSSLVIDGSGSVVPMLGEAPMSNQAIAKRRTLMLYQSITDALGGLLGEGLNRTRIEANFKALPEIAALSDPGKVFTRTWASLLATGRVIRHGNSQRFAVFPPPDGAADGLITVNSGGPEEAPPEGWNLYWERDEWPDGRKVRLDDDGRPRQGVVDPSQN